MATQKRNSSKTVEQDKSFMEKIGEQASHIKDEMISRKDHLVEAVENKIAAVKMSIKKYKAGKLTAKKRARKKHTKKAIGKTAKQPVRKSPQKKAVNMSKKSSGINKKTK